MWFLGFLFWFASGPGGFREGQTSKMHPKNPARLPSGTQRHLRPRLCLAFHVRFSSVSPGPRLHGASVATPSRRVAAVDAVACCFVSRTWGTILRFESRKSGTQLVRVLVLRCLHCLSKAFRCQVLLPGVLRRPPEGPWMTRGASAAPGARVAKT